MSNFETTNQGHAIDHHTEAPERRVSSETKPSFKTTEMIAYVVAVLAVLIAAKVSAEFEAKDAWFYITLLSVGYMISRGLAKSGSREFSDAR